MLSPVYQVYTPRERAKFHLRQQAEGETVEQYVRALYELAANCKFPDVEDAIRDRLVLGLRDKDVSQKLQLEPELKLRDAIDTARHHELVKGQLSDQRGLVVDAVRRLPPPPPPSSGVTPSPPADPRAAEEEEGEGEDHRDNKAATSAAESMHHWNARRRGRPVISAEKGTTLHQSAETTLALEAATSAKFLPLLEEQHTASTATATSATVTSTTWAQ